ncbi:MAG: DUF2312 domain-containing protein [Alphaproteobacteria bacterium]
MFESVSASTAQQLRSFIDRLERLEEEKKAMMETIKEVLQEAKGVGFDVQTLRKVLRLRKMKQEDLDEQEHLLQTYLKALEAGFSAHSDEKTAA